MEIRNKIKIVISINSTKFISIIFSCLFSIRMPLGIEGIINLGQDSLRPGASHGLRAATMERSGFLA